MYKDKLDVYSAQAAFYIIMAFIPMLMLMMIFLKFTPLTEDMILDTLAEIMDENVMDVVRSIVGNVYHGSVAVLSIATFSMLWVASRGILGLANGLNSIHSVRENRNGVFLRLRAMLYTILLVATFILSFGVLVAGMRFRHYLSVLNPIFRIHNRTMRFFFTLFGLAMMTLIFDMLYVFLPNRRKNFRTQLPGAVFTMVSWGIFTWIFTIYLSLAQNLSIVYGGLMTLMVTMLWLYICLYLFFFGAEFNAWRENPDSFPF